MCAPHGENKLARVKTESVPEADEAAYMALLEKLQNASTSSELWKIGGTDDFKSAVAALGEAAQGTLRDTFQVFDAELKGKVKIEDIAGAVLTVNKWEFPPASPKYPNSHPVVLYGTHEVENKQEKFEVITSATQITRFFSRLDVLKDAPQRIRISKETVEAQRERGGMVAADGTALNPMWIVERLNVPVAARNSGGSPF
jgi:hypothetical protein